jgi:DNA helicase-2/ATP-dependent DNA helicase PcrA
LLALLMDLHALVESRTPVQVLEAVLDRTAYAVWLSSQRDGPARLQHVEHLHALLLHATAPDLATWLLDLNLGEADVEPDQDAVALLTVHGAKGREWPVVFVSGIEEGLLPHVRPARPGEPEPDDAEERRLTYVALSRCQVQLYLTYCRTRRPSVDGEMGKPVPRQPSRYLRALPSDLVVPAA